MTRNNYLDISDRSRFKKYDSYEERPHSKRSHLVGGVPVGNRSLEPANRNTPPKNYGTSKIEGISPQQNVKKVTPNRSLASISNKLPTQRQQSAKPLKVSKLSIAEEVVTYSLPNVDESSSYDFYMMFGGRKLRRGQASSVAQRVFYVFGVLVFVATAVFSANALYFSKQAKDDLQVLAASNTNVDAQGVQQGTGSEPAEDKPDDNAFFNYNVDPDKPRYLRIPELSLYSRVKELGLTTEGAVDAPWNVYDTGWYNGSIKPGSKNGVSLILGHVSGRSAPGVFRSIHELKKDQVVEVELGSGEVVRYKVDKVVEYDVDSIDMRKILYEVEPGTHSLRLMTCGGIFDSQNQEYKSRTVVYTTQIR